MKIKKVKVKNENPKYKIQKELRTSTSSAHHIAHRIVLPCATVSLHGRIHACLPLLHSSFPSGTSRTQISKVKCPNQNSKCNQSSVSPYGSSRPHPQMAQSPHSSHMPHFTQNLCSSALCFTTRVFFSADGAFPVCVSISIPPRSILPIFLVPQPADEAQPENRKCKRGFRFGLLNHVGVLHTT